MRTADLRKVDIALLLALDALLRLKNVSQAARSLGISQPALSARLSRLRVMFDDKLFVTSMSGRGIAPTPRAQTLQVPLSEAIAKLHLVFSPPDAFEAARSERHFVIGLHRNPSAMLAPDLIPRVLKDAPHVRIAFVWLSSEVILEQLESGAIDIVLGSELPMHGDLIARTLLEEPLLTAQRKGHPRGHAPLCLDTFCSLPHVIVSATNASFTDVVDQQLAALGRARNVVASLQSFAVLPKVIERSDCVCTMPRSFLARYGEALDTFEPPLPLGTFRLDACWHPRLQDDGGHAWLRRLVLETTQSSLQHR